ncbi:MAG TPA: PaeR7I family type II restriction endonuclease [Dermatophilaceae bacterium]|nr:type II restriction endonuclease [Actinomycetales bacterium]HMT32250.1 PaeR7I family type II restriction endonuclease [Dermatophilaceae bacterium]HMT89794.1 PaeR7I family type II restriction endonuclease [Dermatophilaceae bacterium]
MSSFDSFDSAVRAFWTGRDLQAQRQVESGNLDAGTRGAVTGGKHLRPLEDAVAEQFAPLVERGAEVLRGARLTLPGHYRRSKDWDLLVTFKGALVAAVEFKSQVGSIGNNFNNRTEEALGNAVDIWKAYEEGTFGPVRPWLGFVFVIEHSDVSSRVSRRDPITLFPADPIFHGTSYIDRYRILAQRLVRERLYDATCVLTTCPGEGILEEPVQEVSVANFTAAVAGRIAYIEALNI